MTDTPSYGHRGAAWQMFGSAALRSPPAANPQRYSSRGGITKKHFYFRKVCSMIILSYIFLTVVAEKLDVYLHIAYINAVPIKKYINLIFIKTVLL